LSCQSESFESVWSATAFTPRETDAASSGGVRGVPRQIHAFVSRLAAETTDNDLVEWLANVGIQGAVCRKITPKDNRTFKTAAFKVSCDAVYANLFYDEANWPAGCELRDWVFKSV